MSEEDMAREWREFLLTKPDYRAWSDWLWVKSVEWGEDPFLLSAWLILSVQRPTSLPASMGPNTARGN